MKNVLLKCCNVGRRLKGSMCAQLSKVIIYYYFFVSHPAGFDSRGGRFYEEEDSACPALLEREFHSLHRNVPGLRRAGVDTNAIRQVCYFYLFNSLKSPPDSFHLCIYIYRYQNINKLT